MSIGIIIFVISVIATIIGAVKDNSHKERQKQQKPGQPQDTQQPKQKSFLERLEETFNDLENQMEGDQPEETPRKRNTSEAEPEPVTETRAEKMETPSDSSATTENDAAQKEKVRQRKQDEELQKELEDSVFNDLENVRNEIDREKEKQLQLMEKRARAIINDKYLSERTKRFRLKQLINANSMHVNSDGGNLRFDNDEVINGIIWSEILNKPKRI